jgi:hypothetical protein
VKAFVAQALVLLQPLLLLLITAGATWLGRQIAARAKNRRAAEALQLLTATVAAGVANAEKTTVAALKDPNQPGTWTDTAKREVKRMVVDAAKQLAPTAIASLVATGLDPARLDALLGQLVEQSVLALQRATAPAPLPPVLDPAKGEVLG